MIDSSSDSAVIIRTEHVPYQEASYAEQVLAYVRSYSNSWHAKIRELSSE